MSVPGEPGEGLARTLRLISWNIQVGVNSNKYRHYFTHSWKHVLPHTGRLQTLDGIAAALEGFDLVGIQESDAGSLRTEFVNQTEYLALRGGFRYWYNQTNRRVGALARHSNGLLSRVAPVRVLDYPLPGLPGRGALMAHFGGREGLSVFVVHLALSRRGRLRQLRFLSELLRACPHAVLMGDLNCAPGSAELMELAAGAHLVSPGAPLRTYPSWRPRWQLDHILVSESLTVRRAWVPPWDFSDHLPLAMEVSLPAQVEA